MRVFTVILVLLALCVAAFGIVTLGAADDPMGILIALAGLLIGWAFVGLCFLMQEIYRTLGACRAMAADCQASLRRLAGPSGQRSDRI